MESAMSDNISFPDGSAAAGDPEHVLPKGKDQGGNLPVGPDLATQFEDARNPMFNSLILEKVLSFLGIKDLTSCRLVSKGFNRAANIHMRQLGKAEFFGSELRKLPPFLRVMRRSADFPLSTFGFQLGDSESFRSRFPSLPEGLDFFFSLFGSRVKRIRLGLNDFAETVTRLHLRIWLMTSLSNLEVLELVGMSSNPNYLGSIFDSGDELITFPRLKTILIRDSLGAQLEGQYDGFMSDLLRMSPKLRKFSLLTPPLLPMTPLCQGALRALPRIQPYYLKVLQFCDTLGDSDIRLIHGCGFRLCTLELKCLKGDLEKETLERFLYSQSLTLESLNIGEEEEVNNGIVLEFPVMLKLRTLSVTRHRSRRFIFGPNTYVTQLPALQTLHLEMRADISNRDFLPGSGVVHSTLRKLDLPREFTDPELCRQLLSQFPGLRSLRTIEPAPEVVETIWELGAGLEELEMSLLFKEVDAVLTGIPPKICEWIHEEKAYFRLNSNFMQVVGRKIGISGLKNLQSLRLELYPGKETAATDVTGYFGLLELKNMTSLVVHNLDISSDCRAALSESLLFCSCL